MLRGVLVLRLVPVVASHWRTSHISHIEEGHRREKRV